MIRPVLLTVAVFAATVAARRRNWSGNAAWVAVLAMLLVVVGPSVGAYE